MSYSIGLELLPCLGLEATGILVDVHLHGDVAGPLGLFWVR